MELRRKPPNACGMLRGNTAARRQKLFCTVSGGEAWKQYGFEFQSRYIEHHFEARAKLPPIFDVCVTAFCFADLQLNDRPNGIWLCDDIEQDNVGRVFRGPRKVVKLFGMGDTL